MIFTITEYNHHAQVIVATTTKERRRRRKLRNMSVLKEAPVVSSSVNTFKLPPVPKKPKNNSSPPEEKKSHGKNTKSPLEINAHHKRSSKPSSTSSSKHVKEFNDIFSCYLCHGYLINATTIDNCLHSCKYLLLFFSYFKLEILLLTRSKGNDPQNFWNASSHFMGHLGNFLCFFSFLIFFF